MLISATSSLETMVLEDDNNIKEAAVAAAAKIRCYERFWRVLVMVCWFATRWSYNNTPEINVEGIISPDDKYYFNILE